MKTRITELLGIEVPIVQGGMVWCSGARLAAAVSEAGGLGLIGAGSMTPEVLRGHIQKARSLTSRPFGVNIPLIYERAQECLEVALEEGVGIFFTSAGSPKRVVPRLKDAGAKVFHVVSHPKFAVKSEQAGVDGVVAEGFEAGGHDGREELTTMALVPLVVDAVSVPVIAAGGIADGRTMAAAMALGADGVQVGTRFIATPESSAHDAFKKVIVDSPPEATRLVVKKGIPVRLIDNELRRRIVDAEERGASVEELLEMIGRGRPKRGMFDGDLEEGELEAGMGLGLIRDIAPVAEVITRLMEGYREAVERLVELRGA